MSQLDRGCRKPWRRCTGSERSTTDHHGAYRRQGLPRVFEASGARSAVELAIDVAGHRSTASFVDLPQPDVAVPIIQVLFKDITNRADVASVTGQWPHLIPLLQHERLKAAGRLSHQMRLQEGAEADRLFDTREDDVVKIIMSV